MAIFATGCIKQKSCDCEMEGKFVYLKESDERYDEIRGNQKIVAYFFSHPSGMEFPIKGHIPSSFRSTDTVNVNICVEPISSGPYFHEGAPKIVYSLKCIKRR